MLKSFSLPKSLRVGLIPRIAVVCFLLALVGIGAVPGYWTGHWHWAEPPAVVNIKQLNELQKTGLELPGWKMLEHKTAIIGGHKWSVQTIERDTSKPVVLLLLPQRDHKTQPQVEWMDVNGVEQWQTDSHTRMQFVVEQPTIALKPGKKPEVNVEANFFRAWNRRKTIAMLQWYAWPEGGHSSPSRWFWLDRLAQVQRKRVPWVAVCLQIPMEPLGDLEASRSLAESLGKMVQTALMAAPLARS